MTMKSGDIASAAEAVSADSSWGQTDRAVVGIAELLTVPNMKPEFKAKACQNALLPILSGIAAIGDWMTQDTELCGLKDGTLTDTGYLLTFLANLTLDLQRIEADAQFELHR